MPRDYKQVPFVPWEELEPTLTMKQVQCAEWLGKYDKEPLDLVSEGLLHRKTLDKYTQGFMWMAKESWQRNYPTPAQAKARAREELAQLTGSALRALVATVRGTNANQTQFRASKYVLDTVLAMEKEAAQNAGEEVSNDVAELERVLRLVSG